MERKLVSQSVVQKADHLVEQMVDATAAQWAEKLGKYWVEKKVG